MSIISAVRGTQEKPRWKEVESLQQAGAGTGRDRHTPAAEGAGQVPKPWEQLTQAGTKTIPEADKGADG